MAPVEEAANEADSAARAAEEKRKRGLRKAKRLAFFGVPLLRLLRATWRMRYCFLHRDFEARAADGAIYAVYHGQLLPAVGTQGHLEIGILSSRHRDAEIILQVAQRFGFKGFRGSTTRGGSKALLEMLRESKERPLAVTPDGPRGPYGSVKEGVIQLAKGSGRSILPVAIAASRAWRMGSWDRFMIPKPFARLVLVVGRPMQVPEDTPKDSYAGFAKRLALRLRATNRYAELVVAKKGGETYASAKASFSG